jgi:phosphate transport system ATP-binding protein
MDAVVETRLRPEVTHPAAPVEAVALRVEELRVWYGSRPALRGVTLDVPERRITAVIGPSGCGKSTLVPGRQPDERADPRGPHGGAGVVPGPQPVRPDVDPVEVRVRIGMVFQKPNPFPKSVYENVAFGLRLHRRLSRRELDERVERALRQAALWDEVKDDLHRKSGLELSGGQQQRLCIARALAVEPEVLLLDEPCSALDPVSTARIEALLEDLKREYTLVIVTHNMQQAARVSDFTAFLLDGELVEFGATEELFTRPRDRRTEDYITGRFG